MESFKGKFTSIRAKLFISLCIIVLAIITFLIILNNLVLETFYMYNKRNTIKSVYNMINKSYNEEYSQNDIDDNLEKISIRYDFDILIKNNCKDDESPICVIDFP